MSDCLAERAVDILCTPEPAEKVRLTRALTAAWRDGALRETGEAAPPDRPARPERPLLLPPRDMPKRRSGGSRAGRIALLHALAHIELNAIDLALDMVARFGRAELPRQFCDEWLAVAAEEAEHHALLAARLAALGAAYGDLPAHDGLWQAAAATAHDPLARLAIVPLVLEARGLDVTPEMIERLDRVGDEESAAILRRIYADEIGHVATGRRWFARLCTARGLPPVATWQGLVRRHFRGSLKPPFNDGARSAAGFGREFYAPIADAGPTISGLPVPTECGRPSPAAGGRC
jgi:uncharacterized ferritin-like protein (DUF455 family)